MRKILFVILCGTILLTGCGSKSDENKKNFSEAIEKYLDKKGDLCLNLKKWPVDINAYELKNIKFSPSGRAAKMSALESIGFVSSSSVETEQKLSFFGERTQKVVVKRYALTEMGKKYFHEKESEKQSNATDKDSQGDICYGKQSLDEVVKWETALQLGDFKAINVKYLYNIDELAGWAKNSSIQAAFPFVKEEIDNAGNKKQSIDLKLTSDGWEVPGFDD